VGGVAAGLADRLRLDPVLVRVGFVVLAAAGGLGVVAYLLLWALLPVDEAGTTVDGAGGQAAGTTLSARRMVALGLMSLGGLLLLRRVGLWLGDGLVWPIALVAAGSAVVWVRNDAGGTLRRSLRPGTTARGPLAVAVTGPGSPVRIAVGSLLALGGVAGFLAANVTLAAVRDLGLALVAATVGIGLLLGPWLWRLGDQLAAERRERIRQAERAELAAHLHDSVLQTLALIQRSADQPRRMVSLARRQERELRGWLHSGRPDGHGGTLATEMRSMAEEIEATHDVVVEVVSVGDADLDVPLAALLGAAREACVNVAKHAGVRHVDVYIEVESAQVLAYVRDRGRGFDPGAVAGDRRGIRDSIVGRIERHGGRASVRSGPGEGTEVELVLPRVPDTREPAP
jgi:signal transduction histidine kinase